ncbi:hypothetical protein [Allocoleopsis sp.]|uniref:hypothetical protein n=1 Tax=Allocoleopsis sp. TaxID=3088169 RepID=UPI002FD1850D
MSLVIGMSGGGHTYWEVSASKKLPPGYAVAEDARLPCVVGEGLIEVTASDRGYAPAVHNPNFFLEIDSSPIVLIEWRDGEIRQIYTQACAYWCNQRKDGSLLCSSDDGDAIEFEYWLTEFCNPWRISFYGNPVCVELTSERLEALKPWLENTIIGEAQHYCVICQDHVYEENFGACDCNHIHYSNSLSSWGGCGYAEEDFSEEYCVSLGKIHPSARNHLRKLLEVNDIRGIWELGNKLCGDELDPAAVWIKSLDEDTPDAIAQTLIWLGGMS